MRLNRFEKLVVDSHRPRAAASVIGF